MGNSMKQGNVLYHQLFGSLVAHVRYVCRKYIDDGITSACSGEFTSPHQLTTGKFDSVGWQKKWNEGKAYTS